VASVLWQARRSALTAITLIIRTLVRPTDTTARAGSLAASLSALAPGTTALDVHFTQAAHSLADLLAPAVSLDVARLGVVQSGMVRHLGPAASKLAARPAVQWEAVGEASAAVAN